MSFLAANSDQAVKQTTDVFQRIAHNFVNAHSLIVLLVSVAVALLAGRFIAFLLRKTVWLISRQADKSQNLHTVNRLRRSETILIMSTALIRSLLLIFAVYFWWVYVHPSARTPAVIGASAFAVILIGGVLSPVLRDLAAGSFMMAEQWYGVGDYIKVEPFLDIEGVVEQVTLRSTRLRRLNGEVIWLSNQNIAGVHVTQKGIRTLGLEMFVDDAELGEKLIERANKRLPMGQLLVITPLTVVSNEKVGEKLWHITAIGETAPSREWLIEQSAVDLIKQLDEESSTPVIAHGPLARWADREAEQSFRRTMENARKRPKPRRRTKKPSSKSSD